MRGMLKRLALMSVAGLALAMPALARADDDNDHDLARDLFEHGEIRPLFEIMKTVHDHSTGDIVAIDLTRLQDHWVYRFQIVNPDGHRVTLSIDAATAKVIPDVGGDE